MKQNKLLDLSTELSVEIIKMANDLRAIKEYSILDQIKRSGTSICANIAEANNPQSKADMISKFEIALKEANETDKWLEIIYKSNFIEDKNYMMLHNKCVKIKVLLIASIKTLKS